MKHLLPWILLAACSASPPEPGEPHDPTGAFELPRDLPPVGEPAGPLGRPVAPAPELRTETVHFQRAAGDVRTMSKGAHCIRCNTRWGTEDLAAHDRHVREQKLRMSTDCKVCRYHGAYKNIPVFPIKADGLGPPKSWPPRLLKAPPGLPSR